MHQLINFNDNSTTNSSTSNLSITENNDTDKSVQELIDFVENEFINKEYNLPNNTTNFNTEYNNNLLFNQFERELDNDNLYRNKSNKNQHFYGQEINDHLSKKESNQDYSYRNELNDNQLYRKESSEYNLGNLGRQQINDHLYEQESNENYSYRKELNDAINNLSNFPPVSMEQQQFSNSLSNNSKSSSPVNKKSTPKKRSSPVKRSPIRKKSPAIKIKESSIKKATSSSGNQDVHIPRPPNAFMIFGKFNRKILANQYPQFTNKEISKILGDEWRNLNSDDKEHYHELSNQAHVEHLKKYPGYYYNPLEARKRKADRQNKNTQKTNSKRNYVKQNYLEEKYDLEQLNYNNQSIDLNKLVLTSALPSTITSSTVTNTNYELTNTNEMMPNLKEEKQLNNNYQNSSSSIQLVQQSKNDLNLIKQTQFDNNNNFFTNNSKRSTNQFNLNRQQFDNQQEELKDNQNLLQPNVLYRSNSNDNNNNVLNYLLNNSNNNSGNMNEILNNNEQLHINQNSIHHHYLANCYTTPTIYHITNKDPNLNSTLNDNGFLNNNNLNSNINGFLNYNLNCNFLNNLNISNNQNIPTGNQISLQHQMRNENNLSQVQIYSQSDHLNQTAATIPSPDAFLLDEFLAEYNKYNSNLHQVQISKNQFNKQNQSNFSQ